VENLVALNPHGGVAFAGAVRVEDQLQRLEATASSNDAWQVAYCAEILAARTGLRGGEIKKLRLGMVDLERRAFASPARAPKQMRALAGWN
jgi:integrase